jgi:hypothetical protein
LAAFGFGWLEEKRFLLSEGLFLRPAFKTRLKAS